MGGGGGRLCATRERARKGKDFGFCLGRHERAQRERESRRRRLAFQILSDVVFANTLLVIETGAAHQNSPL